MTSENVEWLAGRETASGNRAFSVEWCKAAADEIERLTQRLAAAEARCAVFADSNHQLENRNAEQLRIIGHLRVTLVEAKEALVDADSNLSAYGHGRPLEKHEALRISTKCRDAYMAIQ